MTTASRRQRNRHLNRPHKITAVALAFFFKFCRILYRMLQQWLGIRVAYNPLCRQVHGRGILNYVRHLRHFRVPARKTMRDCGCP
jgi:hypothetical protein